MSRLTTLAATALVAAATAAGASPVMRLAPVTESTTHVAAAGSRAASSCEGSDAAPWCVRVVVDTDKAADIDVRGTPLQGSIFSASHFRAVDTETGAALPYVGAVAKRAAQMGEPRAEDVVSLAAGSSVSAVVDLSDAFHFVAGRSYSVELVSAHHSAAKRDVGTAAAAAAAHTFQAAADSQLPRLKAKRRAATMAVEYDGCTDQDIDDAEEAIDLAVGGLNVGLAYLDANCTGTDYTDIFGSYTEGRQAAVIETQTNIRDLLNGRDFVLDCSGNDCPDPNTFAFVYPDDIPANGGEHRIHLCDSYYAAPLAIEIDSKPGTLIHEASHFQDIGSANIPGQADGTGSSGSGSFLGEPGVGGTSDNGYGIDNVRNLAVTDPELGIDNGDSNEYFVELQPDITMCDAPVEPTCTVDSDCDDGIFCDGIETCVAGECVVTPVCGGADDHCCEAQEACVVCAADQVYHADECECVCQTDSPTCADGEVLTGQTVSGCGGTCVPVTGSAGDYFCDPADSSTACSRAAVATGETSATISWSTSGTATCA